MGKWRKAILSFILSLLALILGTGSYMILASLKQPPELREPVLKTYNVEVFDVRLSDVREIVSGFGAATADHEVLLSAQVAGEITAIHPNLEVGRSVRRPVVLEGNEGQSQPFPGDLLIQIDPEEYEERVVQAETRLSEDVEALRELDQEQANKRLLLAKAQADVKTYQEEYARVEELLKRGVAAQSELSTAKLELQRYETAMLTLENQIRLIPVQKNRILRQQETHHSDLKLAKLNLNRASVRPPFDGVISEVHVEEGQYLRVGDPIARLTDLSTVVVPVPLSLTDYDKIESAVRAGREPEALLAENSTSKARWKGHVARVAPEADTSTRTVMVYVEVDNRQQESPLLPGTFVQARIDGPVLKQTLLVPRDAIREHHVFLNDNGIVRQTPVTIERTLQSLALLTSGVADGSEVILTNLDVIFEGAQIEVQRHVKLVDELEQQQPQVARPLLVEGELMFGKSQPVN